MSVIDDASLTISGKRVNVHFFCLKCDEARELNMTGDDDESAVDQIVA